ncbi:hypothetical protein A5747_13635 [Mycobacterium sp. IS-836]|uniref:WhiB family transcriptional regulator n=1 Tax=Mycobacterium sp. IS-836 TaxID=1834160 RepID=UPI00096FB912|nr:WhiB family transcriptional regulator [Mycobacterium sp. IS-836]OMC55425.1 hypothetical protein A5747_13635 [Mycobacterium sp. IS-836]
MFFQPTNDLRGAACKDLPEIDKRAFFAKGNAYKRAKKICGGCPVQTACLAECLELEDPAHRYGIWGNTTARERTRLYGGATMAESA